MLKRVAAPSCICPAAHAIANAWAKMQLMCEPTAGYVKPWASPSSAASGEENKRQGPFRSDVTIPGVAAGELPVHTEQPLTTPHHTGDRDFQGSRWSCLARGPAGCHDAPSPWQI